MKGWELREVRGPEARNYLDGLAGLRIRVFRDFPYLYEGDLSYERRYLETYFSCPDSFVALCFSQEHLVGASTAIPLISEERSFQQPFIDAGINPSEICYYGESVLLPELRGKGIGRAFMQARERYARSLPGVTHASFCAVVRPENHPGKPTAYSPLDSFWESEGFSKVPGLTAEYSWKDTGHTAESPKLMQFWKKVLVKGAP